MVNNRIQVKLLLSQACETVKMTQPEGNVKLPMIVYALITNVHVSKWCDRLSYQIDIYDNTFNGCLELMSKVDALMANAGYDRTYESPDTTVRADKDLYHKVVCYQCSVDTLTGNIIHNFNEMR